MQASKVNVCKVSEYARRQVANKQDEKQPELMGEYTDEKTYGVTKTFGATPNHHNVGKQDVSVFQLRMCARSMCARSANMQDDKWKISETRSNRVATRGHGANIRMKKTYWVTKTCGATPNHHNVGKARCERVSAQKTPITIILTHDEKQQNQSRVT